MTESNDKAAGSKWHDQTARLRSGLALHSPRNKFMVAKCSGRVK